MPTVPLLTPDQSPTEAGTPGLNLAVPEDAFGGAVGKALSGLGTSIEGASDRIWARAVELQNLDNDTEAKRADTAYMIKAGELHAQFSSLEGDAARAAFPKYMQDQQAARESIRDSLSNPMAQKMYDSSSLNFMGRNIFNAAGHAAQQTKVAANNASAARVDTLTNNIGENPNDEEGFQKSVKAIAAETRSQGANGGWSEDQIKATTDNNISSAVSKRIVGLARTDPFAAQRMFDQATDGKNLNPNDAARVQATIQTQSRQVISRNVSGMVNADLDHPSDDPEKSLEDRIAEAKANPDVQRFTKNDPLLPDFVEQRVIADYNRSKAITRDADQRNEQTVAAALMQGNKEGILPKSVDELKLIDPNVSAAWDSLKPTTQRKYMAAMAQNAGGGRIAWTDEGLRNYQAIKGQAVEDPVQFLERDIVAEKNLPNSAKRELINLQTRLTQQSTSDPRVGRALQLLKPDLEAAGIKKTAGGSNDEYYQFVGAMQEALEDFHQNNKKAPSYDDIKKIGSRLMQEQVTSSHWYGDSKSPLYSIPVPDEEDKRIKADPFWQQKGIVSPTTSMVQRFYAAEQYNKLYGGSAKKSEAAQ
jgi:hypothetical protein